MNKFLALTHFVDTRLKKGDTKNAQKDSDKKKSEKGVSNNSQFENK